jgi:hypothetical protein
MRGRSYEGGSSEPPFALRYEQEFTGTQSRAGSPGSFSKTLKPLIPGSWGQKRKASMKIRPIILSMIFFMILVFSADGNAKESEPAPGLPPAPVLQRNIWFSESGMVSLESSESAMTIPVGDLFRSKGFGATSGYMLLLLGAQEYLEFEKGELTRYFCGADHVPGGTEQVSGCRAKIIDEKGRPFSYMLSTGGIINDKKYNVTFFLFDKNATKKLRVRDISLPLTLASVDDVNMKMSYSNGRYFFNN